MQFLKAQSDIIGVILIVLIAIALIGVAFTFLGPLLTKNNDRALGDRVEAFFSTTNPNSLPAKIEAIANGGGRDTAVLDLTPGSGIAFIYPATYAGGQNNSIDFSFQSTDTKYAADGSWVSASGGSCPPTAGALGQEGPSVVCVRTDKTSGGRYNITYRLQMRELEDAEKANGFRIDLVQHPASPASLGGTTSEIRIEFGGRTQTTVGGKNLIITSVKILLV